MKAILRRYKTVFDELNILERGISEKTATKALDDFIDFLIDAYVEGFSGVEYMLGADMTVDTERLSAALNKSYDDVTIFEKFVQYHNDGDLLSLSRLMDSEVHRIYNAGSYDGAAQSGKTLVKRWMTVGDDRVRDTHAYLEGMSVPLDEAFVTNDGDSALAPGGFTKAENNCNCRCILQYLEA